MELFLMILLKVFNNINYNKLNRFQLVVDDLLIVNLVNSDEQ